MTTVTRDPWADPWGSEFNSPLDRQTRARTYARELSALDGRINHVANELRRLDRVKLLSPEMAELRRMLLASLSNLHVTAADVLLTEEVT
jgi:hypothetical protein